MRAVTRIVIITCALAIGIAGAFAASAASTFVTLPGKRVFPESVTAAPDGTIYVGSLAAGGVMRVRPGASEAEPWIKPGAFGTRSVLGVLADAKAGILWVCSNDMSALGVLGPGTVKGSYIKGFDLKTGEGRFSAHFPGSKTFCNDIAIGPDGSAYVTNSFAPQILRLKPGTQKLEVWLTDPVFQAPKGGFGLDGIAFGSDGNLYVDTFTDAKLFRVDVKNGAPGKVSPLKPTRKLELTDALRPIGGDAFLLIEGAGRLDRMRVTGDQASIDVLKGGFLGPTGVAVVGTTAWVSEGQLSTLFGRGKSPILPFRLYAVPLSQP